MRTGSLFRCLSGVFVALATLALSGCSSFEKEWRRVGRAPAHDQFAGRWEGVWKSRLHEGHGGRLRCIFTPVDGRRYRAQFDAHWKIFASGYTVPFVVCWKDGMLEFSGRQDLGRIFGGIYRYEGRVTPQRFFSSYDSSYDTGTFEMKRP